MERVFTYPASEIAPSEPKAATYPHVRKMAGPHQLIQRASRNVEEPCRLNGSEQRLGQSVD